MYGSVTAYPPLKGGGALLQVSDRKDRPSVFRKAVPSPKSDDRVTGEGIAVGWIECNSKSIPRASEG